MALTDTDIGILRDIQNYARIERYLGMLPAKLASVYSEGALEGLMEAGLVDEGTIFTNCGSNPSGYRLTDEGRAALFNEGGQDAGKRWRKLTEAKHPDAEMLDAETLDVLVDIYHLSKLRRSGGLVRKELLEDYERASLSALYDLGLIFWVKLKGRGVESGKGYIISDRAVRLLKLVGEID
ncbi:hypothetical protein [Desulfovibrio oxyclinae]|uniref:hypothetical protein n=1 Tax=Desulfovibrio oxyclinae TaxID=63560 RepID=UPI00036A6256|nr:hypothetical protein [Desulfovibrio oxyclinae]